MVNGGFAKICPKSALISPRHASLMETLSVEGTSKMQQSFRLARAARMSLILPKPNGTPLFAGLASRGALPDGVPASRPHAGSIGTHLTGI